MKAIRPPRPERVKHVDYDFNVFINCPFDAKFQPLLHAAIFTIHTCGLIARCALEDSDQNLRFSRILDIIGECRYGIHDLSRIEPGKMPRNNMPLELGVFIGCRHFGTEYDYDKDYLVLDSKPHRYKKHITDLGGEDPSIHGNTEKGMIKAVRDWLRSRLYGRMTPLPSAGLFYEHYRHFLTKAPELCARRTWVLEELEFEEYVVIVTDYLEEAHQYRSELEAIYEQAVAKGLLK